MTVKMAVLVGTAVNEPLLPMPNIRATTATFGLVPVSLNHGTRQAEALLMDMKDCPQRCPHRSFPSV